MARIEREHWRVDGEATAVRILQDAGATFVPELTLRGSTSELGHFVRRFGVVLGLPESGPVRKVVARLLTHPRNRVQAMGLEEGRFLHLPSSRTVAEELATELASGDPAAAALHLPWAFRPLNMDLAGLVEDWADRVRPSFSMYFSQNIDLDAAGFVLRRVFSLPVRGSAEGTLHDPPFAETLDREVGILLEVDAAS